MAAPTPWLPWCRISSTRGSDSRTRPAVPSVEPSSTTRMRSTKAGIRAIVDATSFSSLYAGTTTATVFPSSIGLGTAAHRAPPGNGLPRERERDAGDEADDRADEHRGPAAAGRDLRRGGSRHDLPPLDFLRERERELGLGLLLQELPALLLDAVEQADQDEALRRGQARARLEPGAVPVDGGLGGIELLLLRLEELRELVDLDVGVPRGAVDDDLGEQVRRLGALPAPGPADRDLDEGRLPQLRDRPGHRLARDAVAEKVRRHAHLIRDRADRGRDEPPAGDDGPPVATDVDLLLALELRPGGARAG